MIGQPSYHWCNNQYFPLWCWVRRLNIIGMFRSISKTNVLIFFFKIYIFPVNFNGMWKSQRNIISVNRENLKLLGFVGLLIGLLNWNWEIQLRIWVPRWIFQHCPVIILAFFFYLILTKFYHYISTLF